MSESRAKAAGSRRVGSRAFDLGEGLRLRQLGKHVTQVQVRWPPVRGPWTERDERTRPGAGFAGRCSGASSSVCMLAMAAIGFGIGFMFRGLPVLDALDETIAALGTSRDVSGVGGAVRIRRADRFDMRAGWDAERRVGDLIEHVIVETGCAFAHDVKEGLGGSGNVDHVVMTPAGVWVVETKARWLSPHTVPAALGQAANNAAAGSPSSQGASPGTRRPRHCRTRG